VRETPLNPLINTLVNHRSFVSRYKLLTAVLVCYLGPFFGASGYFLVSDSARIAWNALGAGLLVSVAGSLLLFYLLTKWEALQLRSSPVPPVLASQTAQGELEKEQLAIASAAAQQLQAGNEQLEQQIEYLKREKEAFLQDKNSFQAIEISLKQDLEACRNAAHRELKEQQQFIRELQESVAEHKQMIEKKQQQIGQLEGKVSDLTYEIKTLLKIAESHSSSFSSEPQQTVFAGNPAPANDDEEPAAAQREKQISTPDEASIQLKRCLDIAQKITGSNHFSQKSVFMDSPADSFSIDLRRFCDNLRSEKSCAVLFYSPKEKQLLFANNQIRQLTGWTPEKFVQNFARLLPNETLWNSGVAALAMKSEVVLKLPVKTRTGAEMQLNAHLGMIPTGIFKYHTLAVLFK
jgi:uncharacterized coiled-coil protein SlyX